MSSTLSPSLQNGGVILREASSADSIDKNPDIIPQGLLQYKEKKIVCKNLKKIFTLRKR
jgi:hypothetical protein